MDYRVLECDHCHKTAKMEVSSGWVNVRVIVGSPQELQRLQQLGENALDSGDFCSLVCLANWSNIQQANRELAEALGETGSGEEQPA